MSDFKAKMHQIRFPPGLCPRPRWGSLQCSPDPLAVFKATEEEKGDGKRKGTVGRKGKEWDRRRGGKGEEGGRRMHPLGFSKVCACD